MVHGKTNGGEDEEALLKRFDRRVEMVVAGRWFQVRQRLVGNTAAVIEKSGVHGDVEPGCGRRTGLEDLDGGAKALSGAAAHVGLAEVVERRKPGPEDVVPVSIGTIVNIATTRCTASFQHGQ